MTAAEKLAQLGVSVEDARQFIINYIGTPKVIYNIAAQYSISFDMLADIYGDDSISGDAVKSFFANVGFDTTTDLPIEGGADTTPSSSALSVNSLLDMTDEEIASSDWDTILTEYQAAFADFDWSNWGDDITAVMAEFDWDAWALELQELSNSLADDGSWLTDFEDWFEGSLDYDFSDMFDSSEWVWDDSEEYLDSDLTLDDLDLSAYNDILAMFGITEDNIESMIESLFAPLLNSGEYSDYLDLLVNYDWDTYLAQFSNLITTVPSAAQLEPVGISAEAYFDIA